MFHPMMNKLSIIDIHAARRFFIGAFIAIPFILVFSFIFENSKPITSVEFDSEKIEIFSSQKPKQNMPSTHDETENLSGENDVFNQRASSFPHFAKFMSPLKNTQIDAIKNNSSRLTIIISELGKSRKTLAKVMELVPSSVTLSLSPYAQNHNEISKQLNGYEFETWMDIAALTLDKSSDPGEWALNPTHNFERNIDALTKQNETT